MVFSRAIAKERNANCESASRFCNGIVFKPLLEVVSNGITDIKRRGGDDDRFCTMSTVLVFMFFTYIANPYIRIALYTIYWDL